VSLCHHPFDERGIESTATAAFESGRGPGLCNRFVATRAGGREARRQVLISGRCSGRNPVARRPTPSTAAQEHANTHAGAAGDKLLAL